jgi:sporulation protein YqfC
MGFIDDIKKCFCENEIASPNFRALLIGDGAVYFECVTAIAHYDENEIMLSLKKGGIIIKGEKLYVKKYCIGDASICGKIKSIEMV